MPEAFVADSKVTIPPCMRAVRVTGHGGLDKLEYRDDVATPTPGAGEVLIEVGACGMNNTDINTRTAWYSKSVVEATDAGGGAGFENANSDDSTWGGAGIVFPRIQGADVVGIFESLVGYIEREEIRPLLAKNFPLDRIPEAQREFLQKQHVGNFVITVRGG